MSRALTPFLAVALLAWAPAQEAGSSAAQEKLQRSHFFKNPMLVGVVETEDLRQEPFAEWFDSGYEDYEVQPDALVPYGAEPAIHALYRAGNTGLVRAPTRAFLDELEALGDADTLWHYAQYDLGNSGAALYAVRRALALAPDSKAAQRLEARILAAASAGTAGE